jgi:hypothetical protein
MLRKQAITTILFGCFAAASLAAGVGCSRKLPPDEHNNFHPYDVRHAILHYEYFGDIRGTEDLYEDNFGTREAHITHSELITEQGFRPTITYSVRIGSNLTVVDSVKQMEVKMIDRTVDSVSHLLPSDVPSPEVEFQKVFGTRGFQQTGDTTILGLRAHVWTHLGTSDYMLEWRGLLIGSKDNNGGHDHELRLLSIDTTSPIDPARFVPPSGFPVRDLTHIVPGAPMPMSP